MFPLGEYDQIGELLFDFFFNDLREFRQTVKWGLVTLLLLVCNFSIIKGSSVSVCKNNGDILSRPFTFLLNNQEHAHRLQGFGFQ